MATKKSGGSVAKRSRDSKGRRLGIKRYAGELVKSGTILVRQRGTKFYPGHNVGLGKDHTIFSLIEGEVFFHKIIKDGRKKTYACVKPLQG